jgi:hypothetical protein
MAALAIGRCSEISVVRAGRVLDRSGNAVRALATKTKVVVLEAFRGQAKDKSQREKTHLNAASVKPY